MPGELAWDGILCPCHMFSFVHGQLVPLIDVEAWLSVGHMFARSINKELIACGAVVNRNLVLFLLKFLSGPHDGRLSSSETLSAPRIHHRMQHPCHHASSHQFFTSMSLLASTSDLKPLPKLAVASTSSQQSFVIMSGHWHIKGILFCIDERQAGRCTTGAL